MAVDPGVVAGIVMGAGALGWKAWDWHYERKKTREKGLEPNPERCEKHEIRLAVIDERLERMDSRLGKIETKLGI